MSYFLTLAREAIFQPRAFGARAVRRARRELFRRPVDAIHWFHSIELAGGVVTSGVKSKATLKAEAALVFKYPVAGKTVLDIGAWDGFFSFEAERLGAADVLSTDSFCWGGPGWGTKAGFDFAHLSLRSRCRSLEIDVFDLDPKASGQFDVVLFLGVFYHLRDPRGGLERAAAMSRDQIVVETVTANNETSLPAMQFAPGFDDDATNFWIPNLACLEGMLRTFGFSRFETLQRKIGVRRTRHVVHAWRA